MTEVRYYHIANGQSHVYHDRPDCPALTSPTRTGTRVSALTPPRGRGLCKLCDEKRGGASAPEDLARSLMDHLAVLQARASLPSWVDGSEGPKADWRNLRERIIAILAESDDLTELHQEFVRQV